MGKVYVPPQVKVQFCSKDNNLSGIYEINLGNGIPFRNLLKIEKVVSIIGTTRINRGKSETVPIDFSHTHMESIATKYPRK